MDVERNGCNWSERGRSDARVVLCASAKHGKHSEFRNAERRSIGRKDSPMRR